MIRPFVDTLWQDPVRLLTIACGAVIGVEASFAIAYQSVFSTDADARELMMSWILFGIPFGWFVANSVRVLDTASHPPLRMAGLLALVLLLITASVNEFGASLTAPWTIGGLGMAIACILAIFRPSRLATLRDWFANKSDLHKRRENDQAIGIKLWCSIKNDPFRWLAIFGGCWWIFGDTLSMMVLLGQGVALTCIIRYTDSSLPLGSRYRVWMIVAASFVVVAYYLVTFSVSWIILVIKLPALILLLASATGAVLRDHRLNLEPR